MICRVAAVQHTDVYLRMKKGIQLYIMIAWDGFSIVVLKGSMDCCETVRVCFKPCGGAPRAEFSNFTAD